MIHLKSACSTALLLIAGATVLAETDDAAPSTYLLGPDDVLSVSVPEAEELSFDELRIDPEGSVRLPRIGSLPAAGLTVAMFETEVERRLARYLHDPEAIVTVSEFRSQPVSVLGEVREPGVFQLRGNKTLAEVLSLAGGLSDAAGNIVKVTRRDQWGPVPLPGSTVSPDGRYSVAGVDLALLMDARAPEHNIKIMPQDVVTVPRAEMVYVVGSVQRAGAFPLSERESVSVLQALAMAGGLAPAARQKDARILRSAVVDSGRIEIAVNLKDVIAGRSTDPTLGRDDILFIPENGRRLVGLKAIQTLVATASGIAVWRVGNSR